MFLITILWTRGPHHHPPLYLLPPGQERLLSRHPSEAARYPTADEARRASTRIPPVVNWLFIVQKEEDELSDTP
jgi:hypothetical protein